MTKLLRKWNQLPVALKSSIAIFISSFLLKGIVFLTTPIFTRILNTEQYGAISLYNSWLSILEVFAVLGLTSAGSFNAGLKDNKNTPYEYMSNCLGICNCSTIICFIFIGILKKYEIFDFSLSNKYIILMCVHLIFYPAQIFWVFYQRYEYKYKLSAFLVIVSTFISQLLSIFNVLNFKSVDGAFIKLLSVEVITSLVSIPLYVYILVKGKSFFNFKKSLSLLAYILPLIPHYLAQHIMSSADKIMITKYVGIVQAGIYSVVLNISMILDVFWNAINATLIPYTFKKIEENKTDDLKKIANVLILFFAILCVIIMLIAPEIMDVLAPKEYFIGIYIVPVLVVVSFTKALYNLFANVEFFYKKSNEIMFATIIATVFNLFLNSIFIPKFGFVAATYTTLFSYVILILMHYKGYKSCLKEKNVYNKKVLFVTLLVLILLSFVCQILYLNIYIRYLIVIAICIIIILKRHFFVASIKDLIKK